MTSRRINAACCALFFAVGVALAATLPVVSSAAGPTADNADLEKIRQQISKAQQRVADLRGDLSRGQSQLRDAERRTAKISTELRTIKRQERELDADLNQLDRKQRELEKLAAQQSLALAQDMRSAWQLGQSSPLKAWLAADDPQRAARLARYYQYVQRDRAKRLDAFRETRAQIDASRQKIDERKQDLVKVRSELADRQKAAREASDERRHAVKQLASELKSGTATLERLRADETALKRVLDTAREAFRDIPPQAVGSPLRERRGKLRWPAAGRIAAAYNSPLAEGKLRLNGIVIAAAEGTDVRAVHHGRVVYADWLRGYGLLIIVDHGDGFLTIYGHNQSLLRTVGDWVKEGEPLATVGNTGGRSTAGLYFELRVNGEPVDPMRWLRR